MPDLSPSPSALLTPAAAVGCFEAGCSAPVVFSFVWPWGEPAFCCATHRTHAQQKSDALERGQLSFTVLEPNKTPAVTRDERTQLIAARMSAEEETVQIKTHATTLHNEAERLRGELRIVTARGLELERQVSERSAALTQVVHERDTALADLHDARRELDRIKMLIPRDPPHVVGGNKPPNQPPR